MAEAAIAAARRWDTGTGFKALIEGEAPTALGVFSKG